MVDSMLTSSSIIDALGGTGSLSMALGAPASTISTWRVRGIPPDRWAEIVDIAEEKGCPAITFDALAYLRKRERCA